MKNFSNEMQHLLSFAWTNKNGIYYDNTETQNVIKLIMISAITQGKNYCLFEWNAKRQFKRVIFHKNFLFKYLQLNDHLILVKM